MSWGAQIIAKDSFNVTVQYFEDQTGETSEPVLYPIESGAADDWLSDKTARRIAELTAQTAFSATLNVGDVILPTQSILDEAKVSAAKSLGLATTGTVSGMQAQ